MRKPQTARLARLAAAAALSIACVSAVPAHARKGERNGAQTFIDQPPSVKIASPVSGASYALGETVAAVYSCTAHGSARITGCTGSVANGASIPTTALGEHSFTVSATDSEGGTATRTVVYVVSEGPSAPLSSAPPAITEMTQSAQSWREGRRVAQITRAAPPVGTVFSFSLNEPAAVSFNFARTGGSSSTEKCTRASQKALATTRQACLRPVNRGQFAFPAHAGVNRVAFQGLLSASAKLRTGRYTVLITATDTAGRRAASQPIAFTILP